MKPLVIFSIFCYSAASLANPNTTAFLAQPGNSDKILKSKSSNYCHPKISRYRKSVSIEADNSNVYDTLDECLSSGGKLPPSIKKQIAATDGGEVIEELEKQQEAGKQKKQRETKFYGINWGLGLAYTYVNEEIVKDVSIDDGVIHVNHSVKNRAIALVESHYFFNNGVSDFGHGPFMAIGLVGEDGIDPLSNYGLGWMFGWKKGDDGTSWNIGVGYFVDTEGQQLRSEFSDGAKTELTDPTRLTLKDDVDGIMIMFSANF